LVSSQGAVWSAHFGNPCKIGLRGGTSRACRGRAKRKRSSGRIGRGEQFCTDAVEQQAYLEQRLGVYLPAPLPVKPILQVSGPSRGWLSVWGSCHVAKLGVTQAWAPACEWPPGWAIVVPRHLTTPPVASGHRAGPSCLYNVSASIWAPPAVSSSNPAGNNDCSLLLLQCEMKGNPNAGRTNLPQL
jgi:hypothetical protein